MNNILISIVVPIYQVKEYLCTCIESLITQTYKELEIILVDDGSTDGCADICDSFQTKDDRIFVIHKKNEGSVSARKSGVNVANGKYVLFVDGDDWIENDFINNYLTFVNTFPNIDLIWNTIYYKDYDKKSIICGKKLWKDSNYLTDEYQKSLLKEVVGENGFQYEIAYSLCLALFKKDLIVQVQDKVDNAVACDEDFYAMINCLIKTDNILFVSNLGYHYIQRPNSVVKQNCSIEENKNVYEMTLKEIEKYNGNSKALITLVKKKYMMQLIYHGNIGALQKENCDIIVPFKNAKKNKKIILYGLGNVGKNIYDYFIKTAACEVVAYIDNEEKKDVEKVMRVELNQLHQIDFDYVLISTVKKSFIDEIKENLKVNGISETQIAYVDDGLLDEILV